LKTGLLCLDIANTNVACACWNTDLSEPTGVLVLHLLDSFCKTSGDTSAKDELDDRKWFSRDCLKHEKTDVSCEMHYDEHCEQKPMPEALCDQKLETIC